MKVLYTKPPKRVVHKKWKFPCVVRSLEDGIIVYATNGSENSDGVFSGFVLNKNKLYEGGYYCDLWLKRCYVPLKTDEEVILKND